MKHYIVTSLPVLCSNEHHCPELPICNGRCPLVVFSASTGPHEAVSNISKWLDAIGPFQVHGWIASKSADIWVPAAAIVLAIIYSAIVWHGFGYGLAWLRRRRDAAKQPEVSETIQTGKRGDMEPKQGEFQLVHYQALECHADFTLDSSNETVWATQAQIADAFGISANTVGEHLGNIFKEGELDSELTTRKFRGVSRNGREINLLHYSLDAILSVGYRVSSKRATAFRKWATQTLASDAQRVRSRHPSPN